MENTPTTPTDTYSSFFSMVLARFIRGFVSGAFATGATMAVTSLATVGNFGDFKSALGALGIVILGGGISGALMAVDKAIRATPDDVQ